MQSKPPLLVSGPRALHDVEPRHLPHEAEKAPLSTEQSRALAWLIEGRDPDEREFLRETGQEGPYVEAPGDDPTGS
jgi:hypothetical protein